MHNRSTFERIIFASAAVGVAAGALSLEGCGIQASPITVVCTGAPHLVSDSLTSAEIRGLSGSNGANYRDDSLNSALNLENPTLLVFDYSGDSSKNSALAREAKGVAANLDGIRYSLVPHPYADPYENVKPGSFVVSGLPDGNGNCPG